MAQPPDFSQKTIDLIAYRAAYICSNPDCNRLTIAPSIADASSKIKIGEAAHIYDAREKTIRWDPNLSESKRAEPKNGVWLCASCHTMVDKNKGQDYPAVTLTDWKRDHEKLISDILKYQKSPLPMLRRLTNDANLAQEIVDLLAGKGAFFVAHNLETYDHVVDSLKETRTELDRIGKEIEFEKRLKAINNDLKAAIREFMNYTSKYPAYSAQHMDVMRHKVGISVKELRDEFGCNVSGQIANIIPN